MPDRTLSIEGVRVPRFLYGTAWKEDETRRQTTLALEQGFRGIDTANREALSRPELARIAERHGRAVSQTVFRFALDAGMLVLTGTTDADHMRADLEVFDFRLEPEEVEQIEGLVVQ